MRPAAIARNFILTVCEVGLLLDTVGVVRMKLANEAKAKRLL